MGDNLPFVDLGTGVVAVALAAGELHSCALLTGGAVKCWGANGYGRLGLGDQENRGNEPGEMGDALPFVDLGAPALAVRAAITHNCALLVGGGVKCWGNNNGGQLGLGDKQDRGDEPGEMGDALPFLDFGVGLTAVDIQISGGHGCVLLDNGGVKCWGGNNAYGQLGYGDTLPRGGGPGEMGDALPFVDLGFAVSSLGDACNHSDSSCVLLTDGSTKCWGDPAMGKLGLPGPGWGIGDEPGEMGDQLPRVHLFSNDW